LRNAARETRFALGDEGAMHAFTPIPALIGGVLIGAAATLLLFSNGRVLGISGIFTGLLVPKRGDIVWRALFLVGLFAAGSGARWFAPAALGVSPASLGTLAAAGLLVGVGTHLARGCTSGHGVCGVSRISPRSLIATLTFIFTGIASVALVRLLTGAP
jgi:uncharacterized membrane protein YedE/YeeE